MPQTAALFVECRACGHSRSAFLILHQAGLLQRPERPTKAEMLAIAHRLKCSACGAREFDWKAVPDKDTEHYWVTSASDNRIFHRSSCAWMRGVSAGSEINFTSRQCVAGTSRASHASRSWSAAFAGFARATTQSNELIRAEWLGAEAAEHTGRGCSEFGLSPRSASNLGRRTISAMPYQALANAVLLLHFGVVLFVVLSLPAIVVGNWRGWAWVNNLWFRLAHLIAIGVVVLQAWLGQHCALTELESALRLRAGEVGYERSFIESWVQRVLYYQAPLWVFALAYTAFGALVAWAWWRFPPRRAPAQQGDA